MINSSVLKSLLHRFRRQFRSSGILRIHRHRRVSWVESDAIHLRLIDSSSLLAKLACDKPVDSKPPKQMVEQS